MDGTCNVYLWDGKRMQHFSHKIRPEETHMGDQGRDGLIIIK
jgi:hypothetical protein